MLRKPSDIVHFVDRVRSELDQRAARIQREACGAEAVSASVS